MLSQYSILLHMSEVGNKLQGGGTFTVLQCLLICGDWTTPDMCARQKAWQIEADLGMTWHKLSSMAHLWH